MTKHGVKLPFPLALMRRELKEKGSTSLPITSSNSDLKVCPLLFFISINV